MVADQMAQNDDNQNITSRNISLASHDDLCLFGPPEPFSSISDTGGNVVSWCSKVRHAYATPLFSALRLLLP